MFYTKSRHKRARAGAGDYGHGNEDVDDPGSQARAPAFSYGISRAAFESEFVATGPAIPVTLAGYSHSQFSLHKPPPGLIRTAALTELASASPAAIHNTAR